MSGVTYVTATNLNTGRIFPEFRQEIDTAIANQLINVSYDGNTTGIITNTTVSTDTGFLDQLSGWITIDAGTSITIASGTTLTMDGSAVIMPRDYKSEVRQRIKGNLTVFTRFRQMLHRTPTPPEEKARNCLRDMITEEDYRRYITNGFLMVKGKSGKFYQIFHNQTNVRVYSKGKHTNSLCIHTHKDCPPTDHIINLKFLIEFDEDAFWKLSNVNSSNFSVSTSFVERSKWKKPNLVEYLKNAKNPPAECYYNQVK